MKIPKYALIRLHNSIGLYLKEEFEKWQNYHRCLVGHKGGFRRAHQYNHEPDCGVMIYIIPLSLKDNGMYFYMDSTSLSRNRYFYPFNSNNGVESTHEYIKEHIQVLSTSIVKQSAQMENLLEIGYVPNQFLNEEAMSIYNQILLKLN